ncbi:hypothetical protein QRC92_003945 [Vibrio parahaemolyticus]|uniref:polymorphic toxin type 17 domain-containing protein n=1 Tax=Vibrio parahaemolyticus TaxID=670 RepID=UPI000401B146|nr:polymorphic toxin type 17 domain-containing protein [Vibrio parahaemolyticus]KIT25008.1 hypothetical protein H323_08065 [Vibrio parahaemolyticus VP766]EGR2773254.1 hypothetical protein [Vibrio parahaemolyticus]EGR2834681.1 hypothetical protein [Vibrio parahaemolyticus]EGR2889147.1 hypothetical protein [Vibrio parahaemolyticus]EGR2906764.1 hypothetical protein [Vibrio parahaemolyticus]
MVRVTVCPHFLVDLPQDVEAKYIESNYISPLISCVNEAKSRSVDICLSKEIVELYNNGFPWNKVNDPEWKGYLIDWDSSIRSHLLSYAKVSRVPAISSGNTICNLLSTQVNELFEALLIKLGSGGMPSNLHPEGVISMNECGNSTLLSLFQRVQSVGDFERVIYPWMRIYNQPLPTSGDFPFIPPSNWTLSITPIRRSNFSNNGYVDNVGNEWQWDRFHNDHWDVQHSSRTGDYTNVNTDGSVRR